MPACKFRGRLGTNLPQLPDTQLLTNEILPSAITDDVSQQERLHDNVPFLDQLRRRDPQAFDRLVVEQAPRIQRLVSRLLGWESECDDVVQEVFIAAWESLDRFRGDAAMETWLVSIALNQCRKHRRQRGRWKRAFLRLCEGVTEPASYMDGASAENHDPPLTEINRIHQAINHLSQRDRELVVLCSLEGKSLDEAAVLLATRKNTLEVRLHRARKKLKQILQQPAHE